MRVLVIEDDEAIRNVLERGLRAEGFDVDRATTARRGCGKRSRAAMQRSSWIYSCLASPVTWSARSSAPRAVTTPILVLSAKSGDYDQIDLLDSGADDFLTKPASIALDHGSTPGAHPSWCDDVEQLDPARPAAIRPGHDGRASWVASR